MPSATEELRNKMGEYFGKSKVGPYIDDSGPMKYLEEAGYELTEDWQWKPKPGVKEYNDMTQKEYDCLLFLVQEWDFGGMVRVTEVTKE